MEWENKDKNIRREMKCGQESLKNPKGTYDPLGGVGTIVPLNRGILVQDGVP